MLLGIPDQIVLVIIPEAVIGTVRINFAAIPEDFSPLGIIFRVLELHLSLLLDGGIQLVNGE